MKFRTSQDLRLRRQREHRDDHSQPSEHAIPFNSSWTKASDLEPFAQSPPSVPTQTWTCCLHNFQPARADKWKESHDCISQFLEESLYNPPPGRLPTDQDPQPGRFLLEILTYERKDAPLTCRHVTLSVSGEVMNHTIEQGVRFSGARKWRLLVFDELLDRMYCECVTHGSSYTFSLYQPFLNPRRCRKGDYVPTPIAPPNVRRHSA